MEQLRELAEATAGLILALWNCTTSRIHQMKGRRSIASAYAAYFALQQVLQPENSPDSYPDDLPDPLSPALSPSLQRIC